MCMLKTRIIHQLRYWRFRSTNNLYHPSLTLAWLKHGSKRYDQIQQFSSITGFTAQNWILEGSTLKKKSCLPYGIYTWAYKWPKHFLQHATQDQLIWVSSILHFISFVTYAFMCLSSGIILKRLPFTLPFIAIGQLFNYLVYTRLGKVRAYYGWELGLYSGDVLKGFPFDYISDSQYKGLILCVLGIFFSVNYDKTLAILTGYWVCLLYTSDAADDVIDV